MKHTVYIGLLCIVMVFILTSCAQDKMQVGTQEEIPKAVQDFYIEYMDMSTKDPFTATHEYCHFESTEMLELSASCPPLVSYEIISWEKLSDELWAVKICAVEEHIPNGIYCVNYVGIIDDRYYVMGNEDEIPSALKEGINITPYEPSGPDIISPDDIIGPIN